MGGNTLGINCQLSPLAVFSLTGTDILPEPSWDIYEKTLDGRCATTGKTSAVNYKDQLNFIKSLSEMTLFPVQEERIMSCTVLFTLKVVHNSNVASIERQVVKR